MPAGSELSFVVRGCDNGVREDGRDCGEWRPATVHTDVILSAIGSSRVQLGGTDVLVGIKVPMPCTICHAVPALPRLSAVLNTVHKILLSTFLGCSCTSCACDRSCMPTGLYSVLRLAVRFGCASRNPASRWEAAILGGVFAVRGSRSSGSSPLPGTNCFEQRQHRSVATISVRVKAGAHKGFWSASALDATLRRICSKL